MMLMAAELRLVPTPRPPRRVKTPPRGANAGPASCRAEALQRLLAFLAIGDHRYCLPSVCPNVGFPRRPNWANPAFRPFRADVSPQSPQ